jgi:hypothetical protein
VSTSDVPIVTRRHTRVGILSPPDVLSEIIAPRGEVIRSLTYESEDFCFALPVRERRASARERLLSYREPASRDLQDMHTDTRLGNPCTRAPFRLLSIRAPRQAELRTSSRLAPSSTTRSCDRTAAKTRDATDRCLPPIRTTCTRTSRVSSSLSPLSRRGHPTESWAPWR